MVHKSCINPSVTSLSLDERNVAELLATGWDRHTGWNGCLTAESKSFPREATSQQLWVHVSHPVLCVFCVWSCSQLYGVSIIFSSMQSMFWTPSAVWSSPGWICFNRVSFCSYSFGIATCFSAWMHTSPSPSPLPCLLYVTAEYCSSYQDTSGRYYDNQQCYNQYCCGYCTQRYCCADQRYHLAQDRCSKGCALVLVLCFTAPRYKEKCISFNNYAKLKSCLCPFPQN